MMISVYIYVIYKGVYVYHENKGIRCLYCHDAMVSGEFSSEKGGAILYKILSFQNDSKTHL